MFPFVCESSTPIAINRKDCCGFYWWLLVLALSSVRISSVECDDNHKRWLRIHCQYRTFASRCRKVVQSHKSTWPVVYAMHISEEQFSGMTLPSLYDYVVKARHILMFDLWSTSHEMLDDVCTLWNIYVDALYEPASRRHVVVASARNVQIRRVSTRARTLALGFIVHMETITWKLDTLRVACVLTPIVERELCRGQSHYCQSHPFASRNGVRAWLMFVCVCLPLRTE